ncbi:MAG: hypothetical protein ACLR0N_18600 [Bilophila wadsworthia]
MEANRGVIPCRPARLCHRQRRERHPARLGPQVLRHGRDARHHALTVVDATNARKVLNCQLAPVNDRRIVLTPTPRPPRSACPGSRT